MRLSSRIDITFERHDKALISKTVKPLDINLVQYFGETTRKTTDLYVAQVHFHIEDH